MDAFDGAMESSGAVLAVDLAGPMMSNVDLEGVLRGAIGGSGGGLAGDLGGGFGVLLADGVRECGGVSSASTCILAGDMGGCVGGIFGSDFGDLDRARRNREDDFSLLSSTVEDKAGCETDDLSDGWRLEGLSRSLSLLSAFAMRGDSTAGAAGADCLTGLVAVSAAAWRELSPFLPSPFLFFSSSGLLLLPLALIRILDLTRFCLGGGALSRSSTSNFAPCVNMSANCSSLNLVSVVRRLSALDTSEGVRWWPLMVIAGNSLRDNEDLLERACGCCPRPSSPISSFPTRSSSLSTKLFGRLLSGTG